MNRKRINVCKSRTIKYMDKPFDGSTRKNLNIMYMYQEGVKSAQYIKICVRLKAEDEIDKTDCDYMIRKLIEPEQLKMEIFRKDWSC